ncbi:hypothetical protein MCOR25_005516 [Pyricularia grisea]|uniref:Uncharacterized protein n=1 Tax=Pyricularia grisea TaxID=148305 RepID=A0A6P8AY79_PYRGI|nr:hypothetical protein PgNI_10180 [Pyricularia grisea]KAI6365024.1 hypothetical protein MCOR25_005516 [Pyricularia grisea]TLD07244.1 hypothetical protein PgNI_10180 [Pyricularia grisea]
MDSFTNTRRGQSNAAHATSSTHNRYIEVRQSEPKHGNEHCPELSTPTKTLSSSGSCFGKRMTLSRLLLCGTVIYFIDFGMFLYSGLTGSTAITTTTKFVAVLVAVAMVIAIPMYETSEEEHDEERAFTGYPDLFSDLTGRPVERPAIQIEECKDDTGRPHFISVGSDRRKEMPPVITIKPADVSGDDHDSTASASDYGSPAFGDSSASDCSSPTISPWSDYFPELRDGDFTQERLLSAGRRS